MPAKVSGIARVARWQRHRTPTKIVHNAVVDENEFWTIVDEARAGLGRDRDDGQALAGALVQQLAAQSADTIAGFRSST